MQDTLPEHHGASWAPARQSTAQPSHVIDKGVASLWCASSPDSGGSSHLNVRPRLPRLKPCGVDAASIRQTWQTNRSGLAPAGSWGAPGCYLRNRDQVPAAEPRNARISSSGANALSPIRSAATSAGENLRYVTSLSRKMTVDSQV